MSLRSVYDIRRVGIANFKCFFFMQWYVNLKEDKNNIENMEYLVLLRVGVSSPCYLMLILCARARQTRRSKCTIGLGPCFRSLEIEGLNLRKCWPCQPPDTNPVALAGMRIDCCFSFPLNYCLSYKRRHGRQSPRYLLHICALKHARSCSRASSNNR